MHACTGVYMYIHTHACTHIILTQTHQLTLSPTLSHTGLRKFDSVVIVPVFQSFWILVSVISGMVFFGEYKEIFNQVVNGIMFPFGIMMTIAGQCLCYVFVAMFVCVCVYACIYVCICMLL